VVVAGGAGLFFDGTNSYLAIPNLKYDGTHPICVEAIVTPNSHEAGEHEIVSNAEGSGVSLLLENGKWAFAAHDGNGYVWARSDQMSQVGRRTHVAGVLGGGKVRLFLDGKLQKEEGELPGAHRPSDLSFFVGAGPASEEAAQFFFHGTIHLVRISKTERYTGDFNAAMAVLTDSDTLALVVLDRVTEGRVRDASGNQHDAHVRGEVRAVANVVQAARRSN
jgi:hypothetical protein